MRPPAQAREKDQSVPFPVHSLPVRTDAHLNPAVPQNGDAPPLTVLCSPPCRLSVLPLPSAPDAHGCPVNEHRRCASAIADAISAHNAHNPCPPPPKQPPPPPLPVPASPTAQQCLAHCAPECCTAGNPVGFASSAA